MNHGSRAPRNATTTLVLLLAAAVALPLAVGAVADERPASPRPNAQPRVDPGTRPVDVVICLDTSGSMEHLIDAARARVWDIVNTLARLSPTPELRVGLLTYGADEGSGADGWVVEQLDLTDDLDAVYAKLMELTTKGSEEYVGQVIHTALERMSWSRDLDALRILFVAGNESADQNVENYDFRDAVRRAADDEIIVNALYAGNREQGIVEKWHEIAQSAHGTFSAIDPETSTIQIPTPQDQPLLELNARLNGTYVPYGPRGADGLANQLAQDGNASRLGVQSCSSRIAAKGTALYTNASWDLVDAALQPEFDWATLAEEDLPEALRQMTHEQRVAFVDARRAERESIQREIQRLSDLRERHIRAAIAERSLAVGLDGAMKQAIRAQAATKGFTCDDC